MTFYNTSRFVNLLFFDDSEALTKKGVIRTLYDSRRDQGHALRAAEPPPLVTPSA